MGSLAFEIDPITVLRNILTRVTEAERSRVESDPRSEISPYSTESEANVKEIGWTRLLSLKIFGMIDRIGLVNAFDSPRWLVSIAGLATPGRAVFQRFEVGDVRHRE